MPSNVPPMPYSAQFLDDQGFVTPIWADWFKFVFQRIGGNKASTNDELFTVTSDRIAANAVTSAGLADNAVDTAAIQAAAVTLAKMAANSVNFASLLSTDWTNSISTSGYQKIPSGLYIQWGVTTSLSSGTTNSISFPIAFPTACLQVIPGIQGNSAVSTASTGQWGTGVYSTSGFSLYNRTSVALTFNYIAVGN